MKPAIALLACVAGVAACSPTASPVLVIVNRSDATLALYPTAIVRPCTTLELDQKAIDAGKNALDQAMASDADPYAWVPAGDLQFGQDIPPRRANATEPMTVVVSSQPFRAVEGRVPTSDLPPCGGSPVGISQ